MPGGFAHITMVAALRGRVDSLDKFTDADRLAIGRNLAVCEVGAVAPDYPYLDFPPDEVSKNWADRMHYKKTGEPIREGVRWLRQLAPSADRDKAFAWLLGYAAHIGGDLTIHPVVEMRVGTYQEHSLEHRICEMHQDSFIWFKRNMGEIGVADRFKRSIRLASRDENGPLLQLITDMWLQMFRHTWPEEFEAGAPDISGWHRGYGTIIDAAEEGHKLFPAARHLLEGQGITFPDPAELDQSYLRDLRTPTGVMQYEDIFEAAVRNIGVIWNIVAEALHAPDDVTCEGILKRIPDGNLDTGRDLTTDNHVFWSVA